MSGVDHPPFPRGEELTPRSLKDLRSRTQARIALGAVGSGMPTKALLRFSLDHARAREAVWTAMDAQALCQGLEAHGLAAVEVDSAAPARADYLRQPGLGRIMARESAAELEALPDRETGFDLAITIADGLSATAVALNAVPLAAALARHADRAGWHLAPVVVARQARVALGDPVGAILGTRCMVMLIGERPGLSAADSLGAYVTYGPRPGLPDSRRNCVSNIREGGLPVEEAADQIGGLIHLMLRQKTSGILLRRGDEAIQSASKQDTLS